MIPGLPVDAETEQRVWLAFSRWADHFKRDLATDGIDGLLRDYQAVVESAATQSCEHGRNGSRLFGDEWRSCCGISYEYLNDISVRTALERIVALVPEELAASIRLRTDVIDARLRNLIDTPNSEEPWWHALPRTVAP